MSYHETLESYRRAFQPTIPTALHDLSFLECAHDRRATIDEEIRELFPYLDTDWIMKVVSSSEATERGPLRVGVVFSGGPAPGGHTVLAGLFDTLKEWHPDSTLIGFLGGPTGLLKNAFREVTQDEIDRVRNTGGFSLIGTGRHKIESEDEVSLCFATVQKHSLDGLVFVGGDDSNTDAAFLAEVFKSRGSTTCIIGVPKTIDGDLQSPEIPISFGFDSACKVYSATIGNIEKDCLSTKNYYFFIRLMGRVASHITLECALRTQPNLALISEEVAAKEMTLPDLVNEITDLVEERYALGRKFGVILVPEGLIEQMVDIKQLIVELNDLFAPTNPVAAAMQQCSTLAQRLDYIVDHMSEPSKLCLSSLPQTIKEQLVRDRDPHGNVQVSHIDTAGLLAQLVEISLRSRAVHTGIKIPFSYQTAFCGYEGRSAYPSNFDCTYCASLGRLAAVLISKKMTGYMTAIKGLHLPAAEWEPLAVPLVSLLHFERRGGARKPVIRKALVDITGDLFRHFSEIRGSWRLGDLYIQPGPVQFFGPDEVVNDPCLSVVFRIEKKK